MTDENPWVDNIGPGCTTTGVADTLGWDETAEEGVNHVTPSSAAAVTGRG